MFIDARTVELNVPVGQAAHAPNGFIGIDGSASPDEVRMLDMT
jgi:hypothetical protein